MHTPASTSPPRRPSGERTALVTGASRGLGLLVAEELGRRGHDLLICARDERELARAAERLRATGVRVHALACDLADPGTADTLVRAAREYAGGLDVLVNNAGMISVGPLDSLTEQDFREAMELMFHAPLRLTLAALPLLRESRAGRIATITSLGGRISPPHLLPYSCAKFAAVGFSEGLRAELAGSGVTVTTVVPGLMRTGSHLAAEFTGAAEREYAWFAAGAGLPGLSIDAGRAARAIVRAIEHGRAELVLSPAAKAAVRLHGVAPATTTRLLGAMARLLPAAPEDARRRRAEAGGRRVPGAEAARRLDSRLLGRITALADRAAGRHNEPGGASGAAGATGPA